MNNVYPLIIMALLVSQKSFSQDSVPFFVYGKIVTEDGKRLRYTSDSSPRDGEFSISCTINQNPLSFINDQELPLDLINLETTVSSGYLYDHKIEIWINAKGYFEPDKIELPITPDPRDFVRYSAKPDEGFFIDLATIQLKLIPASQTIAIESDQNPIRLQSFPRADLEKKRVLIAKIFVWDRDKNSPVPGAEISSSLQEGAKIAYPTDENGSITIDIDSLQSDSINHLVTLCPKVKDYLPSCHTIFLGPEKWMTTVDQKYALLLDTIWLHPKPHFPDTLEVILQYENSPELVPGLIVKSYLGQTSISSSVANSKGEVKVPFTDLMKDKFLAHGRLVLFFDVINNDRTVQTFIRELRLENETRLILKIRGNPLLRWQLTDSCKGKVVRGVSLQITITDPPTYAQRLTVSDQKGYAEAIIPFYVRKYEIYLSDTANSGYSSKTLSNLSVDGVTIKSINLLSDKDSRNLPLFRVCDPKRPFKFLKREIIGTTILVAGIPGLLVLRGQLRESHFCSNPPSPQDRYWCTITDIITGAGVPIMLGISYPLLTKRYKTH